MALFTYQNKHKIDYFEGWYLRLIDESNNLNYAIIIGITKESSDAHSFIQIYDGTKLENHYYRYHLEDFSFSGDKVRIKHNYLSKDALCIKEKGIDINIVINKQEKLKAKSAMGFLSKLPLTCFQEVIFMDAQYHGEITIDEKKYNSTGKSYMEKTYGNKFPTKWIWLQSNHFNKEVSFAFAYGLVPIAKWEAKGFFAIMHYKGKEYRFASYNFSRLKIIKKSETDLEFTIKRGRLRLEISAQILNNVILVGPGVNGIMNLDVKESLNSLVHIRFSKGNKVIFETTGTNVGLENMSQ
ncbi:MAG: tocopherol cyclase family protein [Candidatus Izemoplasma sp.]